MSVRLFHKGARLVLVVRRREADRDSEHRWIALHWLAHPWSRIFETACARLDLPAVSAPAEGAGMRCDAPAAGVHLRWTPARYWTTIHLRLTHGSGRKRQLIASALLKAARYQIVERRT